MGFISSFVLGLCLEVSPELCGVWNGRLTCIPVRIFLQKRQLNQGQLQGPERCQNTTSAALILTVSRRLHSSVLQVLLRE